MKNPPSCQSKRVGSRSESVQHNGVGPRVGNFGENQMMGQVPMNPFAYIVPEPIAINP